MSNEITLYNKENGVELGQISEAQLRFLVGELEEESLEDQDYYLNEVTIGMLAADGADEALIGLLQRALDEHGEVDIIWSRA